MYLRYLWSLISHKWHVFLESCRLSIPWLGIIHDWSKFRPSEFVAYARSFYGDYPKSPEIWRQCPHYTGPTEQSVESDADVAWLHHQHRNKHHWQYWILVQDEDEDKVLEMPLRYVKEMLADWRGTAHTYGKPTSSWYEGSKQKMQLHPTTRKWIEEQLQ